MTTVFAPELREKVGKWVESTRIQAIIIGIIIFNAITLGLETSNYMNTHYGVILGILDTAVLTVFVLEILLKLYAFGWRFFTNGWNVFDFIIVGIALMPSSGALSVLRALRVLRILRLISVISQLRLIVEALLKSLPGIISIAGLVLLLFYVSAVISTRLYGADFPEWFGSIGLSMYTLFQVMTLESWSMGIARPIMELHPYAWLFFIPFILFTTFTMLNLFVAIIVDTMQQVHKLEREASRRLVTKTAVAEQDVLNSEIQSLRTEIAELRKYLQAHNTN